MRRYRDGAHLDEIMRERPHGGPEPTTEERYYDSGTLVGWLDYDELPPWTDTSTKREREVDAHCT